MFNFFKNLRKEKVDMKYRKKKMKANEKQI